MNTSSPSGIGSAKAPQSSESRAVSRITAEHRAIARVIGVMQSWVVRYREAGTGDRELFSSMLRYVKEVPHALHHPREDEALFPLLAGDASAKGVLAELHREHAEVGLLLERVDAAFRGLGRSAPNALNALSTAVDDFAEFYWAHMRKEEEALIPLAQAALGEAQWARVASAFCETGDPLFRAEAAAEYRRLYDHIASISPVDLQAYLEEAA